MMGFEIFIEPEVYQDIQQIADWYNLQGENLGYRFCQEVDKTLKNIQTKPYFQVRYDQVVRCIPLRIFPSILGLLIS